MTRWDTVTALGGLGSHPSCGATIMDAARRFLQSN